MILLKRLIVAVAPLACLVIFGLLLFSHLFGWWSIVVVAFATFGATLYLVHGRVAWREALMFSIVPVLLVGSALHILFYVGDLRAAGAIAVISLLLFWWYEENLFLFFYQPQRYQTYALEHITAYCVLLTDVLFFSGLFAARIFLNLSLFYVIPIGVIFTVVSALQSIWSMKVPRNRVWVLVVGQSIVMAELLGVVTLLPTTFFSAGLLLAVPHYVVNNLTRHAERGTLGTSVIGRYVLLGSATIAVTLISSPWH